MKRSAPLLLAVVLLTGSAAFLLVRSARQPIDTRDETNTAALGYLSAQADLRKSARLAADEIVEEALSAPPLDSIAPAEASTGTGVFHDAEWDRLERGSFSLALALERHTLRAEQLFRHRRLNPRDSYIPKPLRDALTQVLQPRLDLLEQALRHRAKAARLDFERLHEAGLTRRVSIAAAIDELTPEQRDEYDRAHEIAREDRLPEEVAADPDGSTITVVAAFLFPRGHIPMVTQANGDDIFYSEFDDLPHAVEAEELRHNLILALGGDIVAWFGSVAGLSDREQVHLMTAIDRRLTGD